MPEATFKSIWEHLLQVVGADVTLHKLRLCHDVTQQWDIVRHTCANDSIPVIHSKIKKHKPQPAHEQAYTDKYILPVRFMLDQARVYSSPLRCSFDRYYNLFCSGYLFLHTTESVGALPNSCH